MSRYLPYDPEQAYLLPPSVREELGEDHLALFIHRMVERMDLSGFEQAYGDEGGALYHPALMLKVWIYAYATNQTSGRRLEQRIREELGLRYLAGGARPDNWALSRFRRQHARALNDACTQVLEMARRLGLGKLGVVAIDSTRVKACASRDRIDTEQRLRNERSKLRRQVRRWQKACDAADPDSGAGLRVQVAELERRLEELPRRLERLRKSGQGKLSRRDPEARFLRERGGFVLGYTAEVAVNQEHLIVAHRLTQNPTDVYALGPMVEQVRQQCGSPPEAVLADAGFYSNENIAALERQAIDTYVPDPWMARELNLGRPVRCGCARPRHPALRAMRRKLRSPEGRARYRRRKALVEPVLGTLKQQRGMRQFRTCGLANAGAELALAVLAHNLARLRTLTAA